MISVEESLPIVKRCVRKTLLAYAHKCSVLLVKSTQGTDNTHYAVTAICGSCSNNITASVKFSLDRKSFSISFPDANSNHIEWNEAQALGAEPISFPENKKFACARLRSLL